MPSAMIDHVGTAKQLLAGVDSRPGEDRKENLVAAETHALLAIAAELAKINETLRSTRS